MFLVFYTAVINQLFSELVMVDFQGEAEVAVDSRKHAKLCWWQTREKRLISVITVIMILI